MLGDWQLAHICLASPLEPLDEAALERVLARFAELGAASRGLIWQRDRREPDPIRADDPAWRILDLSIWRDVAMLTETLAAARFSAELARLHLQSPLVVGAAFWVPVGHVPSIDEAYERWEQLRFGDTYWQRWPAFAITRPIAPPHVRPYRDAAGEWREAEPEAPWIERAPDRLAHCATCEQPIDKGTVRVTEMRVADGRGRMARSAYHLGCAVEARPRLVQDLLGARRMPELIPDPRRLYEEVNARIAILDEEARAAADIRLANVKVPAAAGDALIETLLVQLEDAPEDRGTLAVLADALTERHDVRGELIALQLALGERAPRLDDQVLAVRRDELRALLAPALPATEPGNIVTWGIGFVHKLELGARTSERIGLLGALWQHPSLRLLQHLVTGGQRATEALIASGPRTLRRLELVRDYPLGGLAELVALLPRLESLHLDGRIWPIALVHPRLDTIVLIHGAVGIADALEPAALPRLASLELVVERDTRIGAMLAGLLARWRERMPRVAIAGWDVGMDKVAELQAHLGSGRLPALDLARCDVADVAIEPLRHLIDELVVPPRAFRDAVRHRNKPEWGIGTIVRRFDNKLEVEFPEAGVKVFRADAPFLEPV